jgi:hypothetical protein
MKLDDGHIGIQNFVWDSIRYLQGKEKRDAPDPIASAQTLGFHTCCVAQSILLAKQL